jgi:hypothetical protein
MSHWNLKRAARLGYLAGGGLSLESIMADHVIAARSERAVRCAASRWGLALGIGSPFSILLPLEDRLCARMRCRSRNYSFPPQPWDSAIIAADVRRFDHVINKDGILGTHTGFCHTQWRSAPVRIMTDVRYCGGGYLRHAPCLTAKALAAREWALAGSRSVLWRKLARHGR